MLLSNYMDDDSQVAAQQSFNILESIFDLNIHFEKTALRKFLSNTILRLHLIAQSSSNTQRLFSESDLAQFKTLSNQILASDPKSYHASYYVKSLKSLFTKYGFAEDSAA